MPLSIIITLTTALLYSWENGLTLIRLGQVLSPMTRDIVEVNNFIVLIEHLVTDKMVIEPCRFENDAVGIAFYGSGKVDLKIFHEGKEYDFENAKGKVISFFASSQGDSEHTIYPNQPLQCICVVASLKNLQKLPAQEQEFYQENLDALINPKAGVVRGPEFLMNHEMQGAVDKIFTTDLKGSLRNMFLRSQVTELLSHFFNLVVQAKAQKDTVSLEERQKLFKAEEILAQNITTPPSLNELSKMIGLNSYKLKKNFKEVFGVPVFKHLQNQRLIKAHELLKETEASIQEAAWSVGYESLSSFSNAFNKKFGYRPSEVTR